MLTALRKNKSCLNYCIDETNDQTDTEKSKKALKYKSGNKQNVISHTNATVKAHGHVSTNRSAYSDVIFIEYMLNLLVTTEGGIFCAILKQLYWIPIYYDSHRLYYTDLCLAANRLAWTGILKCVAALYIPSHSALCRMTLTKTFPRKSLLQN